MIGVRALSVLLPGLLLLAPGALAQAKVQGAASPAVKPMGLKSVPSTPPISKVKQSNPSTYRTVGYFVNWAIYGRNYKPSDVPFDKLTHILYSFGDNYESGEVFLTDTWSDVEIHYPGDSWTPGNDLFGNLKQMYLAKKRNRNLKVLYSIGGWTYTNILEHMDIPMSTQRGRTTFVNACLRLIKDLGFDGIDIDWEYPKNATQGNQLLLLVEELREEMDKYSDILHAKYPNEPKPYFEISIAAPAGPSNIEHLPLKELGAALDFINLMAYDYTGSGFSAVTGHHANLNKSTSNPGSTPFDTITAVNTYISKGVPSEKLVLGMPLYCRGFAKTDGLGERFEGAPVGEFAEEPGIWRYKDLPRAGHDEKYDEEANATYSYSPTAREFYTYDTLEMALTKVYYIFSNKLGGAMWWELSGDKKDAGSIVAGVNQKLGNIEQKQNWLHYPDSQYGNLAAGMPASYYNSVKPYRNRALEVQQNITNRHA